ncbi:hypothetical protein ACJJTC_001549 [Scirpophaga incertulas]
MKLSVSAYRAHASAHKKILTSSYQQHYGSTAAPPICNPLQPPNFTPQKLCNLNVQLTLALCTRKCFSTKFLSNLLSETDLRPSNLYFKGTVCNTYHQITIEIEN